MRTIATALESYAVDNNRGPCDQLELIRRNITPNDDVAVYSRVTTPIAYLTSIPKDPFVEKGGLDKNGPAFNRKLYQYTTTWPYLAWDRNDRKSARARGYVWLLHSLGPTRDERRPTDPTMRMQATSIVAGIQDLWIYDPTNGTVSVGLIIRTNKGIFDGGGWEPAP
jgi:hypothetical protein